MSPDPTVLNHPVGSSCFSSGLLPVIIAQRCGWRPYSRLTHQHRPLSYPILCISEGQMRSVSRLSLSRCYDCCCTTPYRRNNEDRERIVRRGRTPNSEHPQRPQRPPGGVRHNRVMAGRYSRPCTKKHYRTLQTKLRVPSTRSGTRRPPEPRSVTLYPNQIAG